jgi:hypothetical protein
MAKTNSIAKFDNSLTEYLINALTDKYGDTVYYTHRYHNLKVFMNPREIPEPHFFVALGISQACFSLSSGKKLNGGLGEEDGYVKRWAERTNINKELKKHFQLLKDQMEAEGSEDITKKALASSLKRRTDRLNQIQVDMTGTGINKAKKDEIEIKKERFNKGKDNK